MNPLVTTITVPFNTRDYARRLCDSFKSQTIADKLEIIFVDTVGKDGGSELARELLPQARYFDLGTNNYAEANNIGVRNAAGKYVMLINPDMWLEPNCINQLVQAMESDETIGAVVPKVQSYARNRQGKYLIDTTGLVLQANGVVQDRGQGQVDAGQYEAREEVFGLSGACGLFRCEALEQVAWNGEICDANYTIYQEDIDTSCRLQRGDWKIIYEPTAVAHHDRTVQAPSKHETTLDKRHQRSAYVNAHSYRNHLLILLTHVSPKHFRKHLTKLLPLELGKFAYVLLNEPKTIALLAKSGSVFRDTWLKRKHFAKLQRTTDNIDKWIKNA